MDANADKKGSWVSHAGPILWAVGVGLMLIGNSMPTYYGGGLAAQPDDTPFAMMLIGALLALFGLLWSLVGLASAWTERGRGRQAMSWLLLNGVPPCATAAWFWFMTR